MILTRKKFPQYFDVKRSANGHRVPFSLNRGSLIEWRQLELYQVTYFPHHILFILSSNYLGWFLSAHFPIWRIISLNLSSLLFQNEQTREILIPCSTFILYVDYVWSPILHDRDICTLSEVTLGLVSLLQAKTGTTKRFYTSWFFFFLGSSLLHIWKSNIYSVAENRPVV